MTDDQISDIAKIAAKNINARIESLILKYNENHDETGRFSGGGGTALATRETVERDRPKVEAWDRQLKDEIERKKRGVAKSATLNKYAPEAEDFEADWIAEDNGDNGPCPGCQDAADGGPYSNPYDVPDPSAVCFSMNGVGKNEGECNCVIVVNDEEIDVIDFNPTDYDVDSEKSALLKGGAGSGNFGHEGRPGEVGGSGEGGSAEGHEYIRDINNREKYSLEMAHDTDAGSHDIKTMDEIAQHPGYAAYEKAVGAWISDKHHNEGVAAMKESIRNGQPTEEAKTLINAIAASDKDAPTLYRGMQANWKPETVEARFGTGKTFNLDLGSFTKDAGIARRFADNGGRWSGKGAGRAHLQFELKSGARAANVNQVQWRIGSKTDELEWISSGKFKVTGFRAQYPNMGSSSYRMSADASTIGDVRYYIKIEQVEDFIAKAALPKTWDVEMLDEIFTGRQVAQTIPIAEQITQPGLTSKRAEKLVKTIDRLRPLRKERAVVINAKGMIVWEEDGGHDFVPLKGLEQKDVEGSTFIHNHPSGVAPSVDDIGSACALRLARLYAIGKTGYTYCVEPPDGHATFEPEMWPDIDRAGRAADDAVREEYAKMLKAGDVDPDEANIEHWNVVNEAIAEATGIKYTRTGNGHYDLSQIKSEHPSHIPVYDKNGVSPTYPSSKALSKEANATFLSLTEKQEKIK